jgi:hypothetical protein
MLIMQQVAQGTSHFDAYLSDGLLISANLSNSILKTSDHTKRLE